MVQTFRASGPSKTSQNWSQFRSYSPKPSHFASIDESHLSNRQMNIDKHIKLPLFLLSLSTFCRGLLCALFLLFFFKFEGWYLGTTQPEFHPQSLEIPCPCEISADVISIWFVASNQSWSLDIIRKFQIFRIYSKSIQNTTNPIS